MKLEVHRPQRYAKMRAHTGVHILNALITQIFPDTRQEWSFVDEDLGRLDFSAPRNLTPQELREIETKANQIIYQARPVLKKQMSLQEAQKLWAKAFFQEKYWENVRVVIIPDTEDQGQIFSAELCWWTHVDNTREIGAFKIISYESIASGIKRISIHTWPRVAQTAQEFEDLLLTVQHLLEVNSSAHIEAKLQKTLQQLQEAQDKIQSLATMILKELAKQAQPSKIDNVHGYITLPQPLQNHLNFKQIVNLLKWEFLEKGKTIILLTPQGQFAIIGWSTNAAELGKKLGLKWGGNQYLFQGKDPKILEIID